MTTAQITRAADMIARKGQTVTFLGASGGSYDPSTSLFTRTGFTVTAKAVRLPLSPFRKNGQGVREGDEQLLISGLDTDGAAMAMPQVNSQVTLADGTTTRTLIAVEAMDPEGDGFIYFDAIMRGHE